MHHLLLIVHKQGLIVMWYHCRPYLSFPMPWQEMCRLSASNEIALCDTGMIWFPIYLYFQTYAYPWIRQQQSKYFVVEVQIWDFECEHNVG